MGHTRLPARGVERRSDCLVCVRTLVLSVGGDLRRRWPAKDKRRASPKQYRLWRHRKGRGLAPSSTWSAIPPPSGGTGVASQSLCSPCGDRMVTVINKNMLWWRLRHINFTQLYSKILQFVFVGSDQPLLQVLQHLFLFYYYYRSCKGKKMAEIRQAKYIS